jgi:hypothetical protein
MIDERKKLAFDPYITFYPDTHQYFDPDNREYTPVSKVLKTFVKPFNGKSVSGAMTSSKEEQDKLLAKWDYKRESASIYGTRIHEPLEDYYRTGVIKPGFEYIIDQIDAMIRPYDKVFPEFKFYSKQHLICGTADIPFTRRKVRVGDQTIDVLDIGDYKTNIANGIRYSSTYWKEGLWKHNGYLLGPLQYLEDCEYNKYCMQLSLYARMAEMEYQVIIGRLFIIYIGLNERVEYIPVPYLRYEADAVLSTYSGLKKLT